MPPERARQQIVAEWLALSPELRSTPRQLEAFAKAACERVRFPTQGDKLEEVTEWLLVANSVALAAAG